MWFIFYQHFCSYLSISFAGEKCRSFIELTPGETQGEAKFRKIIIVTPFKHIFFIVNSVAISQSYRCAVAVSDFRVYIHRSAWDGLPTDVAGSLVFP